MNLHTCESANIAAYGYDEKTQSLYVRFKSGGAFTYKDVPQAIFDNLHSADSKGKFFHAHVRSKFSAESGIPDES